MNQRKEDMVELLEGLDRDEKSISPKYFYDERGSQLFDKITSLPEYYLTGTEIDIMLGNIDEIVALVGEQRLAKGYAVAFGGRPKPARPRRRQNDHHHHGDPSHEHG